jgi:hypothetical protein
LIPIITGAGGVITTWEGEPAQGGGRVVAAGDPRVHEAALKLLSTLRSRALSEAGFMILIDAFSSREPVPTSLENALNDA